MKARARFLVNAEGAIVGEGVFYGGPEGLRYEPPRAPTAYRREDDDNSFFSLFPYFPLPIVRVRLCLPPFDPYNVGTSVGAEGFFTRLAKFFAGPPALPPGTPPETPLDWTTGP